MSELWPAPMEGWPDEATLAKATREFQRTWWRWDEGVARECAERPMLRSRLLDVALADEIVTTSDVYCDLGSGEWSLNRQAARESAAASCGVGHVATRERPCAHVTIGCAGSGKSTVLRRLAHAHRALEFGRRDGAVIVDADRVREALPEYADGRGHQVVADECFSVTYRMVLPAALRTRHDIIFDTLGKAEAQAIVERMIHDGYDVHLLLAEAPAELCHDRAKDRALRNGRTVPPTLIGDMQPVARDTFASLVGRNPPLAGWAVVDTASSDGRGALLQCGGRWTEVGTDVLRNVDLGDA